MCVYAGSLWAQGLPCAWVQEPHQQELLFVLNAAHQKSDGMRSTVWCSQEQESTL